MSANKVGFLTIVRGTFDTGYGKVVRESILASLKKQLDVVDCPEPVASAADVATAVKNLSLDEIGAIIVLQATFADGSIITEIAKATQRSIVVWGIPEPPAESGTVPRLALNSLCGVNLAAHSLKRISNPYTIVFGAPSEQTVNQVVSQVRAYCAVRRLQGAKLLAIGQAPQGFYPSLFTAEELKDTFGMDVMQVGLDEIFAKAGEIDETSVQQALQETAGKLAAFDKVPAEQAHKSIQAYLAVKSIVDKEDVAAVAVECWPRFMTEFGGAACWTVSRLTDEGVMTACETDVFGSITMLLERHLTGKAAFFADLVQVDADANTGVFWHCGAAPVSLAGSAGAQAGVQPNRKVGLALNFALRGGRVTIAKIGRNGDGFAMFITTGKAIDKPLQFLGNTAVVEFDNPVDNVTNAIFTHGLDHHYAVAYGDIAAELAACARALGIPVITTESQPSESSADLKSVAY